MSACLFQRAGREERVETRAELARSCAVIDEAHVREDVSEHYAGLAPWLVAFRAVGGSEHQRVAHRMCERAQLACQRSAAARLTVAGFLFWLSGC